MMLAQRRTTDHDRIVPEIPRSGIHLRGQRGNAIVRRALTRYLVWIRQNYEFPIRVPVYLLPGERLITRDGQRTTASFFAPFDRSLEPYIRIATGDYSTLRRECGRNHALAAYLSSLNHELIHYWQWIETGDTWEQGVVTKSRAILRKYECTTTRP